MENRIYLCIDLKSFYASVESVERGLDPMTANLVVADKDRGKNAICLAITPAMKSLGIRNRCRLSEIPPEIEYVIAKPRMKLYMQYSAEIYKIYLRYISPDDVYVYSIDECFIDATEYIKLYDMPAKVFAKTLLEKIHEELGLRATVGIGTNLFLTKVALDITAKHASDFMGWLDEEKFKAEIWNHRPITDVWNVGKGIAARLAKMGIYDLKGVAFADEKSLYKEFGVNAEFLIDHAKGIEPCLLEDIKKYKPSTKSLSNSQILFENYSYEDAWTVITEMVDLLVGELVEKGLVTHSISLAIGYSGSRRQADAGSEKLPLYTNSYSQILEYFKEYYAKIADKDKQIRKISVGLNDVVDETNLNDYLLADKNKEVKEKKTMEAVIGIKKKFGKNAIMRGVSFKDKATGMERNKLIGGHNGGED